MIHTEYDPARVEGRIVLRPNRSWSWRANTWLVGTLTAISGCIGIFFALRGMWLILPFSILEMSILLACLYYCVRRTHQQEVLTFSQEYLDYERGIGQPQIQRRFQRYFTRFLVVPPPHPWYRRRVSLKCRDTELEIGSFLTGEDRDALVLALRQMIQRLDTAPPRLSS